MLPGLALLGLMLLFSCGTVQASGYLPLSGRPRALAGTGGALLVLLFLAVLALLLAALVWFASVHLSWPVAIVAAGLGLLAGPLAWQGLPQGPLDRPPGILLASLLFVGAAALAALSAQGRL